MLVDLDLELRSVDEIVDVSLKRALVVTMRRGAGKELRSSSN